MEISRILLDTSAYSAFMRGNTEVKAALQAAVEINLNPIVLGELLAGFARGKRRKSNERELEAFLSSPRVNLIDMNLETAERYAAILNQLWRAGTPVPTNDLWIAASAMQYGCHVLTTDFHYLKIPHILAAYVDI